MKKFNILVKETSTVAFKVKADTRKEAVNLISQFYNGYEKEENQQKVNDFSVEFESYKIKSIEEVI